MKLTDQVSKRLADLEAKVSTTVIGKIIADEGNHRATISLGDPTHPLLHVPCVSSYYPRVNQAVRVQRSGNKLLILGSTNFDQSTVISNVAPTPPYPGQLWYDTNDSVLKSWDGSAWVKLGATDQTARDAAASSQAVADLAKMIADQASTSANGKNHNYYQGTPPTSPPLTLVDGDMWFDNSLTADGYIKNTAYIWRVVNGVGSWVLTRDDLIRTSLNTALTAANGKNKNYYQTAMPTGGTYVLGDSWFDSDDGYKLYRWDGTTWAAAPFGATAISDGAITTQKIAAAGIDAGKITSGIIDAAVITVKNLDASKITVGGMDASRVTTGTLGAQVVYSGQIFANKITTANGGQVAGSSALDVATANAFSVAFRVSTGYSFFNNDIMAGGNLYGSVSGTGPLMRGGFYAGYLNNTLTVGPNQSTGGNPQIGAFGVANSAVVGSSNVIVGLGSPYALQRATSSTARVKEDIADISNDELDPKRLLNIPIRQFKYLDTEIATTDPKYGMDLPGVIAEEVYEHYPVAVDLDSEGLPRDWNVKLIVPPMLKLIQEQHKRITELERRLQ
jgi:hypothetical protein